MLKAIRFSLKSLIAVTAFSFVTVCVPAQIAHFNATGTVYFTEGIQPISLGDLVSFSAKIDLAQTPVPQIGAPGNSWQLHDINWSVGPVHSVSPSRGGYVLLFDVPSVESAVFSTTDANFYSQTIVFNYSSGHIPSLTSLTNEIFENAEWTNMTYTSNGFVAENYFRGSAQLTSFSFTIEENPGLPSSPVPEPSTYGLVGVAGLAVLIALRRRRR